MHFVSIILYANDNCLTEMQNFVRDLCHTPAHVNYVYERLCAKSSSIAGGHFREALMGPAVDSVFKELKLDAQELVDSLLKVPPSEDEHMQQRDDGILTPADKEMVDAIMGYIYI